MQPRQSSATRQMCVRFAVIATALLLVAAPAAAAARPAAIDEYSFGPVGGQGIGPSAVVRSVADRTPPPEQTLGVVGENEAAGSPLSQASSAFGPTLIALAAGAALGALGVWLPRRRRTGS